MITARYLKELREKAGMSQTELASLANISQAHIAKIETGKVDPRLSTVNAILSVLQKQKPSITCGDIMSKKVISIKPGETVKKAISVMRNLDISQMPVVSGGIIVGSVSEASIVRNMGKNPSYIKVKEIMDAPFPMVSADDSINILPELLNLRHAVIVTKSGKPKGIITKFNLLGIDGIKSRRIS
ncbi:MAG: CBS domain-containing protein [Candidatus Aenigmarchaeota archaeon]|nr:CBS domain-containing protein [Candidatus Aenigmarchaeota archaeon]